jgi:hypothetical protein
VASVVHGDRFDDLAIGVPYEESSEGGLLLVDAGVVNVIYGSSTGLSATYLPDQLWSQRADGIPSHPNSYDYFGWSLAVGNFNADGDDDLVIGAPYEEVGTSPNIITDAGAVHVIYGSSDRLVATGNQFWFQGYNGMDERAENNDRFGWIVQ